MRWIPKSKDTKSDDHWESLEHIEVPLVREEVTVVASGVLNQSKDTAELPAVSKCRGK